MMYDEGYTNIWIIGYKIILYVLPQSKIYVVCIKMAGKEFLSAIFRLRRILIVVLIPILFLPLPLVEKSSVSTVYLLFSVKTNDTIFIHFVLKASTYYTSYCTMFW